MGIARITLVGDIMCEPLLLKAAKRKGGSYRFDCVFENVKSLFSDSDYVIGNLETPLAGEKVGYTSELFSFNAPDELADAIRNAGISYVSTANNHCLDRGFEGLLRTIQVLDEKGIVHHGTYLRPDEKKEAVYFDIGGQTIALISYTYGANYSIHHRELKDEQEKCIDFLHSYTEQIFLKSKAKKSLLSRVFNAMLRPLKIEQRAYIRKLLGLKYNSPRADDYMDKVAAQPYIDQLKADILKAKNKADIVVFYPHVGGQFNICPGRFTEYVFEQALECGVDAIIASHPHIVQKAEIKSGVPCFYSIGNFSMSPNSVYLLHDHLPEYGLAVHLYVERKIVRCSFSILKIVESPDKPLTVYPVDEYVSLLNKKDDIEKLKADVSQIYTTVTGEHLSDEFVLQREYLMHSSQEEIVSVE